MAEEKSKPPDVEEPYFNLWLDERLKRVEDKIDSVEKRLEGKIDSVEKKIEGRINFVESKIASVERLQYWTLGIFSALFIAILVKLFIP